MSSLLAPMFLLSGVATAAPHEALLPALPGTQLVRIGGALKLGAADARLGYFVSDEEPPVVLQRFMRQWASEGLAAISQSSGHEGVASAFLTAEGIQVAVIVRRHGDRTLVFSAAVDLWASVATDDDLGERVGFTPEVYFVAAKRDQVRQALGRAAKALDLNAAVVETSAEALVLEHRGGSQSVLSVLVEIAPGTTAVWELREDKRW